MSKKMFGGLFGGRGGRRRPQRRDQKAVRLVGFESLDHRVMPAVTATFLPAAGLLSIFGDNLDNTITVSRNAAGSILVNGGAVNDPGRHVHRRQHQPDPGLRPGRE